MKHDSNLDSCYFIAMKMFEWRSSIPNNNAMPQHIELSLPRKRLLAKAESVGRLLLAHKVQLGIKAIIVFGSLARGTADYRSDVDMLVLVEGGPVESSKAKDYILSNFYNDFEGEWLRVDVHTCGTSVFFLCF